MKKILFLSFILFNYFLSFSQAQGYYGFLEKNDTLTGQQIQKLKEGRFEIPKNNIALKRYGVILEKLVQQDSLMHRKLVLQQSKVLYDESDMKDGFYFGEYVYMEVTIFDEEDIIIYKKGLTKSFSITGLIDLKKKVKTEWYSSVIPGEYSRRFYSYLDGNVIKDENIKVGLENVLKLYFK